MRLSRLNVYLCLDCRMKLGINIRVFGQAFCCTWRGLQNHVPECADGNAGEDAGEKGLDAIGDDDSHGNVNCEAHAMRDKDAAVLQQDTDFGKRDGEAVCNDAAIEPLEALTPGQSLVFQCTSS